MILKCRVRTPARREDLRCAISSILIKVLSKIIKTCGYTVALAGVPAGFMNFKTTIMLLYETGQDFSITDIVVLQQNLFIWKRKFQVWHSV